MGITKRFGGSSGSSDRDEGVLCGIVLEIIAAFLQLYFYHRLGENACIDFLIVVEFQPTSGVTIRNPNLGVGNDDPAKTLLLST